MSKKQTAVEWLVEQMISQMGIRIENTTIGCELFEQAQTRGKEQMVFAQMDMFNHINKDEFSLDYLNKRDAAEEFAEQYYNETYGNNK